MTDGREDDYEGYDREAAETPVDPWQALLNAEPLLADEAEQEGVAPEDAEASQDPDLADLTAEERDVADAGAKLIAEAERDLDDAALKAESNAAAQRVYEALLERVGEANPRPRIEPVRRLAELAGSPHEQFPVIHIAGTNGKTSTSRVIESLLRAHGLRTGLLTSPHLEHFTERIQVDGQPIDGVHLEEVWHELQLALEVADAELTAAGQGPITFFEACAVLSYAAFADVPVEVAVVEVGMGGEWDATNIVQSDVSVFTPIGLDHTGILGDNITQIAATKAKIMNPESVAVTSPQEPQALDALRAEAASQGISLKVSGEDFALTDDRVGVGGRGITVRGLSGHAYETTLLPLFGRHQAENALTAIAAVEAFFGGERPIPDEVYEEGLATATSPGRLQVLRNEPSVVIDSAHNPHGARALRDAYRESFHIDELALVIGVLEDKDAEHLIETLLPLAARVIVTPVESPRTSDAEVLADIVERMDTQVPVTVAGSLTEALDEAVEWATPFANDGGETTAESMPSRGVLVAGSVVLAGEAIRHAHDEGWQNS